MFSTFATKKDIDRHVKTSLSKLPEHEKYQRGLAIARQYLKLNEFASAEHWLSCFLSVQEDSAQAHKLLGHCYERQKKIDRAITSYQRSLQLDSKQTGLITDVCKLLLSDDNFSKNLSKAKHWCDLAESERINHEAVLNLKLKVANKDAATDNKLVKEIILKEILARPMDPGLRIRLVKHFTDEKKLDDAFKYCYDIEMKFTETFQQSVEWANAISSMLTRYVEANASSYQSNWSYWLLAVMTLDRQIYLNLLADSSLQTIKQSNIREIGSLLFELDQTLRKFSDKGRNSCSHKQLAEEFLLHYRGQLLLHSASLLFKNEKQATNSKARDVTTKCLPLLFLAYQCGVPDSDEPWLRHTNDTTRQLVAYWNKQAAFRCCQAGSSILSCVDDSVDASVIAQIQSVTESKIWNTAEDLVNQVRQFCADMNWKKSIFRALYSNNGDQVSKMSSSYFMQSASIGEPLYELPKREHIQMYLEIAQYLCPSSLAYQIYLGLGVEDLAELRCKSFNGLNFSTNNLDNCNVETLNQLDVDSFLYCAILVAKSCLEGERKYQDKMNSGKPRILPAPNMIPTLCEENKADWWNAACAVFKNTKSATFSSNKQLLQHGLQAVRGTGTPITDVIVLLKLGKILAKRINNTTLPEERRQLELRTESVYKAGVLLWKMRNESSFNSTNIFFKYGIDSFECSQEAVKFAEDALTYLAGVYFKHGRYEEFTQDFGGIPLPFAAYFRAEAFKKLDESSKTPLKTKKFYSERARDCIKQTQKYLELPYIEKSHPLHYVVHSEIKRLQFNDSMDGGGSNLNSSLNGFGNSGADDSDHFQSFSSSNNAERLNRSEREIAVNYTARTSELESLIRNMMEVLTIVKDDVLNIRNDVGDIQERLVKIEDHIHKKPAEDDAATAAALNDLYILDELQNPSFVNQPNYNQALQQQLTPNLPGRLPPNHPAAAVAMQHPNPYQQFYNTSYPMYMQQYAAQQQQQQRAQMGAIASPLHTYQDSSLLVPASPYYQQQQQQQQQQPPQQPPPIIPPAVIPPQQPAAPKPTNNLFEQALQTPTLLNTWNSTYNAANALQTSTPASAAPLDKVPPVNVVITNSDPLPTNISVGSSQPTYSVTIPPQHIKHSVISNTTPAVTTVVPAPIATGIENISPVGQQQPVNTKFPIAAPKVTMPTITPGMFSQSIAASSALNNSGAGKAAAAADEDEDDDDTANISGEYDPRPDFKPIIALPDEIEVKTGEEDEEQIFCGRSKLLRMMDREWKERGLGDLKILKSKTDPSKYRIVMRREQVHKIAANHTITPELIIKPMEKNNKCYTWAALDFADEEPKKETFCARFSTPELAKEFFDKFNQAKNEVARLRKQQPDSTPAPTKTDTPKSSGFSFSTPKSSDSSVATAASKPTFGSLVSKPIFGSSTVTTTPPTSSAAATTVTTSTPFQGFSFANNYAPPKLQTPAALEKPAESSAVASKPSPFASFTFGANTINSSTAAAPADSTSNKSFTDIFSSLNKLATPPSSVSAVASTTTPAALNTSGGGGAEDAVEEFVPTADFKPVIPLPDLVEVKTGEEGFDCVYEHRAKMFRMDKAAKEWKERGLGNIRVLVKKDDNNVARLLMRREQVLKLCCNQLISKDLKFTVSEKNNNTLTWVGHDYSENELLVETFAIRFKTADIAKDFHNIIKKVQGAMTSGGKTEEPKKSDKKSEPAKGFGDKFKPKAGAWNCEACYVSNKPDDLYCMACGGPKDSTVPKKESNLLDTLPKSTSKFSFGVQPTATEAPKFSFGVPAAAATTTTTADATKKAEPKGFGDQFKPKAGSWTCSGCYISNKGDDLYCMACETPKDSTVPKKDNKSNILGGGDAPKFNFTTGGGFSFGLPAATNATPTAPASTTGGFGSIGSTPGSGFSFTPTKAPAPSAPTTATTSAPAVTSKASFQFELPKPTMSFGSTLSTTTATTAEDKSAKPAVPEKSTFEFVFKPKSPGGGKSKSPGRTISVGSANEEGEGGEEGGDDEGAAEEENNTYFTPVIPLPEKVEVKTGEEEEDVLYSHRTKLFRFVDKEWKERGIGDVKILKHKTNGKLRVVMRRDQVLKICLNHALDADVQYQKKDEKSWQFVVNDFSEGTFEVMNFSLRFKTAEIAGEFRDAIDRALSGEESVKTPGGGGKLNSTLESTISTPNSNINYSQLSDISLDDKELTTKLKLPEGFFDSPKQPCKGCRGCDPDSFVFPSYGAAVNEELVDDKPLPVSVAQVKKVPIAPKLSKSPKKVSFSENSEELKVTSLFGSVALPSAMTTTKTEVKSSPFSINSFVAAEKQSSTGNIFGSVSQPAEQGTPKSIFGGGFLSSTATGSPATGSIFSSSLNTTPNPVIKPAQDAFKSPLLQPAATFGTATSSPSLNKSAEGVQLFGSSFGTSTPPTQSIFGGSPAATTASNSTTPVFGSSGNMTSKLSFGSVSASDQKVFGSGISFADAAKGFEKKADDKTEPPKADILEKADSGMSFASLASGTDGFLWNKKAEANSGFVGLTVKEDIFTRMANKSKNDSGAGEGEENDEAAGGGGGDENYDPHYEPIIKLPDEIEVRTGEEDEVKLFGERAKLYRYDSDAKEWKERGVGELKILHHPGRSSYRLLLRREQIFKLVLNHAISSDLQITPMNNSGKAFVWGAMNHAEEGPQLEKLAARFKNEDLAASFKAVLEQCQEKLRQKPDLEPDQD